MKTSAVAIVLWAAWAVPALGQSAPAQDLGPRYIDPVGGFSLQSPAQTDFKKEFSPSLLASWLGRDKPKGPIVWQLRVLRAREGDQTVDLEQQVRTLRQRLSRPPVKLEAIRLTDLPVGQAVDLRTTARDTYERQVWIQNAPGRFVIFAVSGSQSLRRQLDLTLEQVLGTVEVFDPTVSQQQRQQRLDRGKELLGKLEDAKLAAAFEPSTNWLMINQFGKPAGFTRIRIGTNRQGDYQVDILTFLAQDPAAQSVLRHQMSLSTDRREENWEQTSITNPGLDAVVISEKGSRKDEMIKMRLTSGITSREFGRPVDGTVNSYYLPRAMGMVLGRLVDLSSSGEYAFAVYNSQANQFDVRTFSIEGPQTLVCEGQEVPAVRVKDQPAENAPASTLWLDMRGNTIGARSDDQLTMEQSNEQAVRAAFPKAGPEIDRQD